MQESDCPSLPQKRPRGQEITDSVFAEDEGGCEGVDTNWGPSYLGAPKKFAKRFEATKMFLTYPHCTKPKEEVFKSMQLEFPVEEAIISHEKHACGHTHVHAYLKAGKRLQFRDHGPLDRIGGKHGNYKTAKGRIEQIAKYLSKEDPDPFVFGLPSIKTLLGKKIQKMGKEKAIVADKLASGISAEEVALAHPQIALELGPNRLSQVSAFYKKIADDKRCADQRAMFLGLHITGSLYSAEHRISSWLFDMFDKVRSSTLVPRQYKNLWISGPPRCGKSRFITQLSHVFKAYFPPGEKYWSNYDVDAEFILFDEQDPFMMGVRPLNGFSGGNCTLPIIGKGKYEVMPKKSQPLVVCTQISLSERIELYKSNHADQKVTNMDKYTEAALRDRFIEIAVPEGEEFEIHWIVDELLPIIPGLYAPSQQKAATEGVETIASPTQDVYQEPVHSSNRVPWSLED